MSTRSQTPPVLGRCPECRAEIATLDVLIEYETADGRPAVWAACPDCETVVHPE